MLIQSLVEFEDLGPVVLRNSFNGETFTFPPTSNDRDVAAFSCSLEPEGSGGGNAMLHIHPHARETFRVRTGCLLVHIDGADRLIFAGDSITIEAGEKHRFYNHSIGPTKFDVEFSPAQRHRDFFMTFGQLTERKPQWFSHKGKPDFLLMALMLHEFRDHLYLAAVPTKAQKLLFALATPLALMCGYRLPRSR